MTQFVLNYCFTKSGGCMLTKKILNTTHEHFEKYFISHKYISFLALNAVKNGSMYGSLNVYVGMVSVY